MNTINHELFDKRLRKPLVYRLQEENEDITLQRIVNFKVGKAHIRFFEPNYASVFISSAEKALGQAKDAYNTLIRPRLSSREAFTLSPAETVGLFDYLEAIQSAIVMAFTAVECLANDLIPESYIYNERQKNGGIKTYSRDEIIRWISTMDKLALIIPQALQITSPNSYTFWPKFTKLKDIRNDIIHFRSLSPIQQKENDRILSLLLNEAIFGKVNSAFELIKRINTELPPDSRMPVLKNSETLIPVEIPTWDSLGATKIE